MLKRPSSRRKKTEQIRLNLVPVLDTMVALIGFLLFTMSFLSLVSIESPFPTTSRREVAEKLKEKPLQLTVSLKPNETEIWSPFNKFKEKVIANVAPGQPDVQAIHNALIDIKEKFPLETQVVVSPFPGASYDVLISLMDSLRMIQPTDPPIYLKNEQSGTDEVVKVLFPKIIFGNLLGDA